jgi:thioredoxin-dependent peroxiredoxin
MPGTRVIQTNKRTLPGRSSTRIAAQQKEEAKVKPATKKRAAKEEKDEASTSKKKVWNFRCFFYTTFHASGVV